MLSQDIVLPSSGGSNSFLLPFSKKTCYLHSITPPEFYIQHSLQLQKRDHSSTNIPSKIVLSVASVKCQLRHVKSFLECIIIIVRGDGGERRRSTYVHRRPNRSVYGKEKK